MICNLSESQQTRFRKITSQRSNEIGIDFLFSKNVFLKSLNTKLQIPKKSTHSFLHFHIISRWSYNWVTFYADIDRGIQRMETSGLQLHLVEIQLTVIMTALFSIQRDIPLLSVVWTSWNSSRRLQVMHWICIDIWNDGMNDRPAATMAPVCNP